VRRFTAPLLALGLALTMASCTNAPYWRFDKYDVRGEFRGATCSLAIDGRAIPLDSVPRADTVQVLVDDVLNIGLPETQGLKSVACNGVMFSIVSPLGILPAHGAYRVTADQEDHSPGVSTSYLKTPSVTKGLWPLAAGVYLTGYDGTLQLDSIDRHQVWARFHFRGRRQVEGE